MHYEINLEAALNSQMTRYDFEDTEGRRCAWGCVAYGIFGKSLLRESDRGCFIPDLIQFIGELSNIGLGQKFTDIYHLNDRGHMEEARKKALQLCLTFGLLVPRPEDRQLAERLVSEE